MTTPDPTLAARLAAKLKCATEDPSLANLARFVNSCADAFEAGQLITTAEADARVEAAVQAEREACAWTATSFLVGDPKNGIPLRGPMASEVAASIRARGVTG